MTAGVYASIGERQGARPAYLSALMDMISEGRSWQNASARILANDALKHGGVASVYACEMYREARERLALAKFLYACERSVES